MGAMTDGGYHTMPNGPLVPTAWSGGNLNAQPLHFGAAERSAMTAGTPWKQPPANTFKDGRAYYNINDLIAETVVRVTNQIMTQLQGRGDCFYVALPPQYTPGDTVVVDNIIYNNDAPAQRAPEAPNPVMTTRTTSKRITLKQHGVSIRGETMALTTPQGKAMLASQIRQAEENFNQYFVCLIADELMRPHQPDDLSGGRMRRSRVFNSEDEFITHLSRIANQFNVWNKSSNGLNQVARFANEAITSQGGDHDLLIVPQGALDLVQQAQIANMQGKAAPTLPGVPRVMTSTVVPMVGADPLDGKFCTGQRAIFEYAGLPPSQMDIDVHDETADSMQQVSFKEAVEMCGAFEVNDRGYVTGLTDFGTRFFSHYRNWRDYLEEYDALRDLEDAFNRMSAEAQVRFLDAARESMTKPGSAATTGERMTISIAYPDKKKQLVAFKKFLDMLKPIPFHPNTTPLIQALVSMVYEYSQHENKNWESIMSVDKIKSFALAMNNSGLSRKQFSKAVTHLPPDLEGLSRELGNPSKISFERRLITAAQDEDAIVEEDPDEEEKKVPGGADKGFDSFLRHPPRRYPAFFAHLLKFDLPVPGTFLLVRPCVTHTASATIACKSGGATGNSFYGQSTSAMGSNAGILNNLASIAMRFGAAVTNANNLTVMPHSKVRDYIGGGSSRLLDWSRDEVRAAYRRRDWKNMGMICILCPPGYRNSFQVIDFTGHFPADLVPSSPNEPVHYPNADVVQNILHVNHEVNGSNGLWNMQAMGNNTFLWQMQQRPRHDAARKAGINEYEGAGPLGPFAPGVAAQRRGETGPPVEVRQAQRQTVTLFQS